MGKSSYDSSRRAKEDTGLEDTLASAASEHPAYDETLASSEGAAYDETLARGGGPSGGYDETIARASVEESAAVVTAETEGRYRIRRELAAGGQSRVYIAYDTHLGREVAFKQPRSSSRPEDSASREVLARFLREARITARLEHPNIVPVYEIGQRGDGSYYCAQKLIRSNDRGARARTLRGALEEADTLDERLALLPHYLDVCHAIAYAHEHGVVHRDIKPENVVIGRLGETVVLDWGLAKVIAEEDEDARAQGVGAEGGGSGDPAIDDGATEVGFAFGTPSYMSPEQAAGDVANVDDRSDIWSLGALLYEILTGRPPFTGKSAIEIIERVHSEPVAPVRAICPDGPAALAAVAEKALARAADKRYQRAADLAEDIAAYESGLRVGVYRYSFFELARLFIARHRTISAVILIAALLLAGAAGVAWHNANQAERFLGEARENLAHAFVEKARRAERQLQWERAAAYYAAARAQADTPPARWGAMLTENRAQFELTRLEGHDERVTDLTFSSDGQYVAAAGLEGAISLWDVESHELKHRLTAGAAVYFLEFSPGAGDLVTGDEDGWLTRWSVETGRSTRLFQQDGELTGLHFSPTGERIAIVTSEGSITIYELATDEIVWERGIPENSLYDVAYTPDGETVVAAGWDATVRFFDARSGEVVREIPAAHGDAVLGIRVSPRGDLVVTGGRDGLVKIWRIADGELLHQLEGHRDRISGASFSPDGELLATSSTDKTIRLWDVDSGQLLVGQSFGHEAEVSALSFSPRGDALVWAGDGVWIRPVGGAPERTFSRIESLWVTPDGSVVGYAFGKAIRLLDVASKTSRVIYDELGQIRQVDGEFFGAGLFAGRCQGFGFCIWDVEKETILDRFKVTVGVIGIAVSPDGSLVATGDRDGAIIVWSVTDRAIVHEIEAAHEDHVFSLDFSPDGDILASASYDGEARLWDTRSWELRGRLSGHTHGVRRVKFSPDGQLVATASWDRTVRLWDADSGQEIAALEGHSAFVYDVAFDPEGRFLVSGSWDGTLRVWDYGTWRELAVFVSDEARVYAVAVLPGRDQLVYAGHALHLLDLDPLGPPEEELARVLDRTGLSLRGIELVRRD